MKKATCTAVAEHNRIQLVIRKGEPGYKAFANVLNKMEAHGSMSWYGDITDADGKEQSGLVITCKPNPAVRGDRLAGVPCTGVVGHKIQEG